MTLAAPIPFNRLLDESMRLLRVHFRQVYLPVAVPLALLSGMLPVGQYVLLRVAQETGSRGAATAVAVGSVGLNLLFLLVLAIGYGALVVAAVDAAAGRPIDMGRCWLVMLRPRILGTNVLAWLGIGLGLACCLFPGLFLALQWAVLVPVMLEEAVFGPTAMSRSAELMRFNPLGGLGNDPRLRAFLIYVVGGLLGYALSFAVQLPFLAILMVLMFRGVAAGERPHPEAMQGQMLWAQVPSQITGTAAQVAVQLVVALAIAILFFEVRRRKEGRDLEAAVDRLAAGPATGEPAGA